MKYKWVIPTVSLAVAVGVILLFTKGFMHYEKAESDISIGRVLLSEMEEQSIDEVQGKIQAITDAREAEARAEREAEEAALIAQHEAEAAAQAEAEEAVRLANFQQWCAEADAMADADQFKSVFANSVVIGDSIVEGILECDLMLTSSVVCQMGGNVHMLSKYLPVVESLQPENIFLYIGFNDIGMNYGNKDAYYEDIVWFISQLQAICPGVPMYMNRIIPVISTEFLESEEYWNSPEYNVILERVAAEYGLTMIDNLSLVEQDFYYKDGYHMIYPYYPRWLRRMAETAGLM